MVDTQLIANTALQTGLLVGSVVFIGLIGIMLYYFYRTGKRYNRTCVIFKKNGFGLPDMEFDIGGIFVDPVTKNKRFYLKRNRSSLEADNVPELKSDKKTYVFLRRKGQKNFEYISFENLFDNMGAITVGEEDVNWAVDDYIRTKALAGQSTLQQLLPYIGLLLMGVFVAGIAYMVLKDLPALAGTLNQVADKLQATAQIIANAGAGTRVN